MTSSELEVTVYSMQQCVQCDATTRALARHGVAYREVAIETLPDAEVERFKERGLRSAPIVSVGDEAWSGFRPDRIKALAAPAWSRGPGEAAGVAADSSVQPTRTHPAMVM